MANELIRDPLSVVRARVKNVPVDKLRVSSDWGVPAFFEQKLGLNNPNGALKQIPSLNAISSEQLPDHTLVRFRCMVQDVLDPEYYVGVYEEVNQATKSKTLKTAKYQDLVDVAENCEINHDAPSTVTYSRIPLFCVPVPGESPWIQTALGNAAAQTGEFDTKQRDKRKRGDSREVEMTPEKKRSARATAGTSASKRTRDESSMETEETDVKTEDQKEDREEGSSRVFNRKGCLAKLYDHQSSPLKVCDVVEFIGVFSAHPALTDADEDDSWGRFNPPSSAVPRLHILTFRKIETDWGLVPQPSNKNAYLLKLQALQKKVKSTRTSLLNHITCALGGDSMAAEALLMHLVSRVHYRRTGLAIGKMVLSLTNAPPGLPAVVTAMVQNLLPSCKCLEVNISALNKGMFMAVKDYELNHLSQGELQAPKGTYFVLDETKLSEGKLEDRGVKNLSAIQQVMGEQKLVYDFKYHNLTFDTDLPMLVLSKGKSIFKTDCSIALNPSKNYPETYASPNAQVVAVWREYLLFARQLEVEIPEKSSKTIQDSFVEMRKVNPKLDQKAMHLRMGFSRLLAVSFLENALTKERWDYAVPLYKHID